MATYRLLIVSGYPWTLRAVSGDLAREGYDMITAGSLRIAVRLGRYFEPDLVILDYPFLGSGLDVRPAGTDTPLLVLTPRDCPSDKLAGFRPEMDDCQTKPFAPAELALRVEAMLCRRIFMADPTGARDCFSRRETAPRTPQVRETVRQGRLTGRQCGHPGAVIAKPAPVGARLQFSSC